MSNPELASQAIKGLTDSSSERAPGYCQKYTRQQIIKTYGEAKYAKYFEQYMKGSAYETMLAFRDSPYAVSVEHGSVVGDILYKGRKTSGKFGHVGIRIPENRVAENSSSHIDEAGDRDARGTRSLNAFGNFELIVRLPRPQDLK